MNAAPAAGWRGLGLALAIATVSLPAVTLSARQRPAADAPQQIQDPEAEGERAAVLVGGEPVVYIPTGIGPYSAQVRAERISQRAADIVRDRHIADPSVTISDVEGASELRVGTRLLMVVTQRDAATLGAARPSIAAQYAHEREVAIRAERVRYAPATLIRSGFTGLAATLVFAIFLWLLRRGSGWLRAAAARLQARRSLSLRLQRAELVSSASVTHAIAVGFRIGRLVVFLLAFDLYLTFVLGLFPWTRAVSLTLLNYLVTPIEAAAAAVIGYLPRLMYVLVIGGIVYVAMRLVAVFFAQIAAGRLVFASFPAEWANPTNKIVRVLLAAFGLVAVFPYLPASDSAAFTGVSVLLGLLLSLSSSSAIANMVAGIVLTYTGAFRLGDRVKLGDATGDIIETSLLATRIRTIKNEHITIPNSLVLGSSITNFSRPGPTPGLILHTSVTIGYDVPWRRIHELLISAARATPRLLADPPPFVWQTALNDFYVTYEINAYTDRPQETPEIYAALHANIQEAFFAAGVEIMSPHYTAIRDGNTVAMPASFRASGYSAPPFRVDIGREGS